MARKNPRSLADAPPPESKMIKASIVFPAAVLWRLNTIAGRLDRDRSEFVTELVDSGLARYALDKALRAFTSEDSPVEPSK